ncbi:S8/S53 family peptidase [Micromonospora sp. NPDC049374]|uniref:S8 family peptidase n=1 Tax=Micromonospora sp. NPDC049374 TaxID=3154352 RepID=UPI00341EFBA5
MNIKTRSSSAPAPDEFPEHRSREQLKIDAAHVRRQLKVLTDDAIQGRTSEIIGQMQDRQDRAPGRFALPFDRYPVTDLAGRPTYVLVARGQLVVEMDSAGPGADPRQVLRKLGYRPWKRAVASPERRLGVYEGRKRPQELAGDVRKLAELGITAAPHLVVPLGHIIKGDDYPFATAALGDFVPDAAKGKPGIPAVRVAVIDTGITPEDRTDSWLDAVVRRADNTESLDVLPVTDGRAGDGRLDWSAGHGSFAAGIVQRVAPRCEVAAYRFTRSDGLGTDAEAAEAMLRAVKEAAADGVRLIINASIGTPAVDGVPPLALQSAVRMIADRFPEVLIVASAGNNGSEDPMYPAAFDGVVAVGALTEDLLPAPFSSHGDWVDCSCVGLGVVATFVTGTLPPVPDPAVADYSFPANSWAVWSGTSFSAPQISGMVARACLDDPGLTPRDALDALLAGRRTIPGYGRVLRVLPGTPV